MPPPLKRTTSAYATPTASPPAPSPAAGCTAAPALTSTPSAPVELLNPASKLAQQMREASARDPRKPQRPGKRVIASFPLKPAQGPAAQPPHKHHQHQHQHHRCEEDARQRRPQETQGDYKSGGYAKIKEGDMLNHSRYEVLRKLGVGHFSCCYLCWDQV